MTHTQLLIPGTEPTGWAFEYDLENDRFKKFQKEVCQKLPRTFASFDKPKEVLPWEFHRLENQGSLGSCRGHSGATSLERLQYIRDGEVIEMSNIFMYLATQKRDGLLGRDAGSTMVNGAKQLMEEGVCPLSFAPNITNAYPNGNMIRSILSQKNYAAASKHKIKGFVKTTSFEQTIDFIGGGGTVDTGMIWGVKMVPHTGKHSNKIKYAVTSFQPTGRGGHAVAFNGYCLEPEPFIIVSNSHNYFFSIYKKAFEALLRHSYTSLLGYHPLAAPQPIRPDFKLFKR
jgi:hypothetical protein